MAWLGRILAKAGTSKIEKARKNILNGIKIIEDFKLKPLSSLGYLLLGEIFADSGQKDLALKNLKKAESMFQEMGMDYWLGKTQEVLGRF